ncbi:YggT family protein [Candidatus Saccharibacteria bacterium]|nr:YggT family protein [Candidatus Saccharibacteria bacterium]
MITNAIWFIVGLFEVILGLRFIFKILGANPTSGFIHFLYSVSGFLSAPFDNIFGVRAAATQEGVLVFEPSILVAMLVYLLIGWGIVKLLNLNHPADTV